MKFFARYFFLEDRKYNSWIFGVILLGMIALPACRRWVRPQPPNIILITVDALRADHLGVYGYSRDTTPFLDALSRKGVLFQRAFSQSSYTKTSMASLLTGLNPDVLGVYLADDVLPDPAETLAEVLKANGYSTGCVQANPGLEAEFGFKQGFDWYVEIFPDDLMQKQQKSAYRADRIIRLALDWIKQQDPDRPIFLYLHFMETHFPYLPPAPYDQLFDPGFDRTLSDFTLNYRFIKGPKQVAMPAELEKVYGQKYSAEVLRRHLIALYDGELRSFDHQFQLLLNELAKTKLKTNTLLVICADHGEEFEEHGQFEHGKSLFQEVTFVPLLFYLPGRIPAGRKVSDLVRNLDIFPTLLDLAGIPIPSQLQGRSLAAYFTDRPEPGPQVSFARLYATGTTLWAGAAWGDGIPRDYASMTTEQWRMILDIKTGALQLFNRAEDPNDHQDLSAGRPEEARSLGKALSQYFHESEAAEKALGLTRPGKTKLDAQARKKLESLGYVNH